jgi:hypothetical protein
VRSTWRARGGSLDLARAGGAPIDYVGTAYVAGERRGLVLESELECGQTFHNTYERSKLRGGGAGATRARGEQSTTIYRPSIIVGDSRTGRTASFKVLYWPLKIFARGFRVVPGHARHADGRGALGLCGAGDRPPARADRSFGTGVSPVRGAGAHGDAGRSSTGLAARFFRVNRSRIFVQPTLFMQGAAADRPVHVGAAAADLDRGAGVHAVPVAASCTSIHEAGGTGWRERDRRAAGARIISRTCFASRSRRIGARSCGGGE